MRRTDWRPNLAHTVRSSWALGVGEPPPAVRDDKLPTTSALEAETVPSLTARRASGLGSVGKDNPQCHDGYGFKRLDWRPVQRR